MTTIEDRIKTRQYSSPVTARAGIKRSKLGSKLRMHALVDDWEKELAGKQSNGNGHGPSSGESAPGFEAIRQAHTTLAQIAGTEGCSIKRLVNETLAFDDYIERKKGISS